MPKRIILIAIAAVATLAACSNGNINDLYSVATATPGPTSTPFVNPSASAAVVTVTVSNSPLPSQVVDLYNSTTTGVQVGTTPIRTLTTNASGVATFSNLTPTQWYCFATTYTASPPGSLPATQELCINYWGDNAGINLAF
jgi:hypothetical protein